jgi:AcrR family transcriptional regulator
VQLVEEAEATPGAEPGAPKGGRPRDEARELAILDSAIELLSDVGYEALTVEAVAARAGVGKATIYRRWSGKADLVAAAVDRMADSHGPDPEDTGSLRGDLLALTELMFDKMGGTDGGLLCGLALAVRTDSELGRLLDSHKHEYNERVQSLIVSRAKARGEIAETAEPPELIHLAVALALFQVMTGKALDAEFAAYLVDKVLIPLTR